MPNALWDVSEKISDKGFAPVLPRYKQVSERHLAFFYNLWIEFFSEPIGKEIDP